MLTTTKHNILIIAASVLIAAAIPFVYKAKNNKPVNYTIFHSGSGWGYDININGKLVIHQEYIPVIAEKKEFSTAIQAKEAARLVILKLKNNKFPTLSKTEVEQICGDNK